MRKLWIASLVAAACLPAAQLDANTVTVIASRILVQQADQFTLSVSVLTGPDATLDDVLVKLKGSGITAANLTSVSAQFEAAPGGTIPGTGTGTGTTSAVPYSRWTFFLTAPFTKMKSTMTSLNTLQASLGKFGEAPVLDYYLYGTQVSPESQASQACPFPELVSGARQQAEVMGLAAGRKVGGVMSISDGTSIDDGAVATGGVYSGSFQGTPSSAGISGGADLIRNILTTPRPAGVGSWPGCSLTVQFRLLP